VVKKGVRKGRKAGAKKPVLGKKCSLAEALAWGKPEAGSVCEGRPPPRCRCWENLCSPIPLQFSEDGRNGSIDHENTQEDGMAPAPAGGGGKHRKTSSKNTGEVLDSLMSLGD